jgi:hypothetical protein
MSDDDEILWEELLPDPAFDRLGEPPLRPLTPAGDDLQPNVNGDRQTHQDQ